MKKFSKILENKDLSYTSFFGKSISHKEALFSRVKSNITDIVNQERGISEKDFKRYDKSSNLVNEKISDEILEEIVSLYEQNKRINYISEILFDKYFKNII